MGLIRLLSRSVKINISYLFRKQQRFKSVVEKYPDMISAKISTDMFANYRGYIRNDLDRCNGCGLCVPACPVKALWFDSKNRQDGSIEVSEFRIDLGKCFSCGACVDICPETSLVFSKDFELVSDKAKNLVMVLHGSGGKPERDITRIRTYEVRR